MRHKNGRFRRFAALSSKAHGEKMPACHGHLLRIHFTSHASELPYLKSMFGW